MSQLIRYSRNCGSQQEFFNRGYRFAADKEATKPMVPMCGQVEVITSKV
jgi:hypothetical protein